MRLHVSLFISAWVLMRKIEKILALLRTGGVRALARTLFRRLVFKRWRSVVFVDDMSADHPPVEWPAGYKYQLYPKTTDLTSDEHSALEAMNASGFVAELGAADGLYVVWYGREVASYGAIMCGTRQHSVLGLNVRAPLVGLCGTVRAHRKRGLYSRALVLTARELGAQGHKAVFVEVLEDNEASIAGIMKAGFIKWRVVDAQIYLGRFVRRDGHWHWVRSHSCP